MILRINSSSTLKILTFIAVVCLFVSFVFADPLPYIPPQSPNYSLAYFEEVLFGEGLAWLIGATVLWKLLSRKKGQITMDMAYGTMLLAMIVSFLVGLLIWKIFGFI